VHFSSPEQSGINAVDRFVVTMGSTLIVHYSKRRRLRPRRIGRNIGPAFQFSGAKAAFNAVDRSSQRSTYADCVHSEGVFGHDISGRTVGPAFKFTGSKAAFNAVRPLRVSIGTTLIYAPKTATSSAMTSWATISDRRSSSLAPGWRSIRKTASWSPSPTP